jgi:AcrR family transcriptional regulator
MSRWSGNSAWELSSAAVRLFAAKGYDATSIDDIANAAGVTARTFYRIFGDKEEVLFYRDQEMELLLVAAVERHYNATGDGYRSALSALRELAATFHAEKPQHVLRARVLGDDPRLRGRQLVKQEGWQRAMTGSLVQLGVPVRRAALSVAQASAVAALAYDEWLRSSRKSYVHLIDSFDQIRSEQP